MTKTQATQQVWDTRRTAKAERLQASTAHSDGKVIRPRELKDLLQAVIRPGDRVALEGDNQKQGDYLSRTLAECDPKRLNGLHMLISSVSRPEHLDLFERGIADKLDLAYAGPQSVRIAQMVEDGTVHIGAIHTYVELYARMFVDLAPHVVLLCAEQADRVEVATPIGKHVEPFRSPTCHWPDRSWLAAAPTNSTSPKLRSITTSGPVKTFSSA